MPEIQWENPKITIEKVPDPNTVDSMNIQKHTHSKGDDYFDNNGSRMVLKNNPFFQDYISDLIKIIEQNGGMSKNKIWEFIRHHEQCEMGIEIGITDEDVERDIGIARAHREKGDYSITRKKFDIFQKSIENPTNNNVFVIEKKVPLKQGIFALIGRIEGNLTIRPNTKMQINTFLGEKLYVNILGIKWEGRIRQEISRGSDIMLSVSGISIDSVDVGDEVTV